MITDPQGPKVLHVVPALFGADGTIGGAERYAAELASSMGKIVPTRLVALGERAAVAWYRGLRVTVMRGRPVRGGTHNRWALGLLGELRHADIIHCHQRHVVASSTLAGAGRVCGKPVYVTDHGGGGWDVSRYISTDRWFAGHLHVSAFSRELAAHPPDVSATVIYGGVSAERFTPQPWTARRRRVVFVGRLLPHKGVHDLIGALPRELGLDLIGPEVDPNYAVELRRLADGRDVRFRGAVTDGALAATLQAALCLVLPSCHESAHHTWTPVPELLGQVLLEAMAAGIPTVCTRVTALPEVVQHGVTGIIVAPGSRDELRDAMLRLASSPLLARELGAAGRRLAVSRFSWDAVARHCLDVYAGVSAGEDECVPAAHRRPRS